MTRGQKRGGEARDGEPVPRPILSNESTAQDFSGRDRLDRDDSRGDPKPGDTEDHLLRPIEALVERRQAKDPRPHDQRDATTGTGHPTGGTKGQEGSWGSDPKGQAGHPAEVPKRRQ